MVGFDYIEYSHQWSSHLDLYLKLNNSQVLRPTELETKYKYA